MTFERLAEHSFERLIILRPVEYPGTPIGSIQHVIVKAAEIDAGNAGHLSELNFKGN
jgi:hypothetical protein